MTAKTADKPRKGWRFKSAACGSLALAALLLYAAVHLGPVAAVFPLIGVLVVAGLLLWRRLDRYRAGWLAARRSRRAQGFASRRDLRRHMSLRAARKRIHVMRPSLAGVRGLPPSEYATAVGKARGVDLYASHETFVVADGPSRSGKTGLFAGMLADAPGFGFSATTSPDVWQHTFHARSRRDGPVHTLNTEPDFGIPTTLTMNPLAGCETADGAIRAAGYLIDAVRDKNGKDSWWDDRGAELLRRMMRAGALARAPVTVVRRWTGDPYSREPLSVLAAADPDWAQAHAALLAKGPEYVGHVANSAGAALEWLDDPALRAVACPRDSWEGLDLRQMLTEGGTIYVIGTDRPHASAAPLCALLGARLFDTAKTLAATRPGRRLDPPATFVIDEPAITFRTPLDKWCAEAARNGILLRVGFQSPRQRNACWGDDGAQAIFDNATTYLAFGGYKDAAYLDGISKVCGEVDTRQAVRNRGSKTTLLGSRPLLSPKDIREIPKGKVLVLHDRMRPVIADVGMVWDRPGYREAVPADAPPGLAVPQPALEPAPQRAALTLALLYLALFRAAQSRRRAIGPPAITVSPAGEVSWPGSPAVTSAA